MLDNIIGQSQLKRYLSNEIKNDTLMYGYIIEGERFMGKEYIAQNIADEITVPSYITTVTPSNDRKLLHVDDIRELRVDAYSQSFGKAKKVYILPNADDMNPQSQNAFLKILEEPPQDCVFFLLVENKYNLLSTIRSRCTTLSLARYTDKEIQEYLVKNNLEYNPEIVRLCDGTLRKYVYLDSQEFKNVNDLADRILLNIRKLHSARIFAITKHVKKLDKYVGDLLDLFLFWYRDMYVYMIVQDDNYIESVTKKQAIKDRIKDYTIEEVYTILQQIEFARLKFAYNGNLEMTINTLLLYMKGDIK